MSIREQKKVMAEEDWDNLIILDACRYDIFKHFYDKFPNIEGGLEKVRSAGTNSHSFAKNALAPKKFYDHHLITENPVICKEHQSTDHPQAFEFNASEHFKKVDKIWLKHRFNPDESLGYMLDLYTGDKTIFWFIQPHTPYVGEVEMNDCFHLLDEAGSELKQERLENMLRQAYEYNFFEVLFYVSKLVYEIEGDTVITADHGELFNEEGFTAHPASKHLDSDIPELRHVPWLRLEGAETDLDSLNNKEYVDLLYKNVLGRGMDTDTYVKHLADGKHNRKEVLRILLDSQEFYDKEGSWYD